MNVWRQRQRPTYTLERQRHLFVFCNVWRLSCGDFDPCKSSMQSISSGHRHRHRQCKDYYADDVDFFFWKWRWIGWLSSAESLTCSWLRWLNWTGNQTNWRRTFSKIHIFSFYLSSVEVEGWRNIQLVKTLYVCLCCFERGIDLILINTLHLGYTIYCNA